MAEDAESKIPAAIQNFIYTSIKDEFIYIWNCLVDLWYDKKVHNLLSVDEERRMLM